MTMLDGEDVALSAEAYTGPCQTSIMKLFDIVLNVPQMCLNYYARSLKTKYYRAHVKIIEIGLIIENHNSLEIWFLSSAARILYSSGNLIPTRQAVTRYLPKIVTKEPVTLQAMNI